MLQVDLSGKTAVVTGGSGNLGRVMVRTLARCGANVAIQYNHNIDMAKSLIGEIQDLGVQGTALKADITIEEEVDVMKDKVISELGAPQIIVNNAVIQYDWRSVLEQPLEDYESQFRSCVMQNVLMARAFVPNMIKGGHGRIIAINTECVMQNEPGQSAYVSGKRGMDGVLRVLAKEIGEHQITVNQVAPGWTITDRDRNSFKPLMPRLNPYSKNVPLKRRGEDQEIANVVAFLASDLASFITGAYIPVCGGNVMPAI